MPNNVEDFHLPTDLIGVTPGKFDNGRSDGNLVAALGPFCNQVRRTVKSLGAINQNQQKKNEQIEEGDIKFEYTDAHKAVDVQAYNKFKELLPPEGSISFIREFNFAGFAFEREKLNQLDAFTFYFTNPDFEFIDKDMETLRKEIYDKVVKFRGLLAVNTWPCGSNNKSSSVPPEWEIEQPERFNVVVRELHSLTDEICDKYDRLVRLAKIKLAV